VPLTRHGKAKNRSGLSREWAAEGPRLLGVRRAMKKAFERIHRSNLARWEFFQPVHEREIPQSLGLTCKETYDIEGVSSLKQPKTLTSAAKSTEKRKAVLRCGAVDTPRRKKFLVRTAAILQYGLSAK